MGPQTKPVERRGGKRGRAERPHLRWHLLSALQSTRPNHCYTTPEQGHQGTRQDMSLFLKAWQNNIQPIFFFTKAAQSFKPPCFRQTELRSRREKCNLIPDLFPDRGNPTPSQLPAQHWNGLIVPSLGHFFLPQSSDGSCECGVVGGGAAAAIKGLCLRHDSGVTSTGLWARVWFHKMSSSPQATEKRTRLGQARPRSFPKGARSYTKDHDIITHGWVTVGARRLVCCTWEQEGSNGPLFFSWALLYLHRIMRKPFRKPPFFCFVFLILPSPCWLKLYQVCKKHMTILSKSVWSCVNVDLTIVLVLGWSANAKQTPSHHIPNNFLHLKHECRAPRGRRRIGPTKGTEEALKTSQIHDICLTFFQRLFKKELVKLPAPSLPFKKLRINRREDCSQ